MYPNQLLKYTERLGSKKQQPELYDMPDWFKASDINYKTTVVVRGGNGHQGPSYSISATNQGHCDGFHGKYAGTTCSTSNSDECESYKKDGAGKDTDECDTYKKKCSCAATTYYSAFEEIVGSSDSCPTEAPATKRNSTSYTHNFIGGAGGTGGYGWLAVDAEKVLSYSHPCSGGTGADSSSSTPDFTGTSISNGATINLGFSCAGGRSKL